MTAAISPRISPIAARAIGFAVAGATFAADQVLKWAVMGPWRLPEIAQITLTPFFNLTYTENHGVSLGLFTAGSDGGRLALIAMTAAIALAVLVWLLRERDWRDTVGLGLILGGALGNIRDRATVGFVIDYADLHIGEWRPFLVFNLADAAITIGVLIILARSFLSRDKRGNEPANPAPESLK